MTGMIPARPAKLVAAILASAAVMAVAASAASAAEVIYNSIPSPFPGNVPSLGYEATSTAEFGGQVEFAGTARKGASVTVAMSSWACRERRRGRRLMRLGAELEIRMARHAECVRSRPRKYGRQPRLHVDEHVQDAPIARPPTPKSAAPERAKVAGTAVATKNVTAVGCSGSPSTPNAMLPGKAIISVAYNTKDYGAAPTGVEGPYDSLNVGLTGPATVGAQSMPDGAYWNTSYGPYYCDKGVGGTGTFRLDPCEWTGYQPEFQVKAG